jgi:threonine/homoserine/homoserine lactone efflux protein
VTTFAIASFFGIMLVLAAMPSASVALVVARSSSCGLPNGIATILGIVAADLIFVAIAVLGMSALAFAMGSVFSILKMMGGAYLIWLGVKLITSKEGPTLSTSDNRSSTLLSSFAAGFLLTLGDLKAILFYASLFPTLMDLTSLSALDIAIVVGVTVLTVGGVKLVYAMAARAIVLRLDSFRFPLHTGRIAGGLMIGTGGYIITKA